MIFWREKEKKNCSRRFEAKKAAMAYYPYIHFVVVIVVGSLLMFSKRTLGGATALLKLGLI
jgi:hypothetical protein